MMNGALLASDLAETVALLAFPAVLWLFLYLWAWEDSRSSRAAGFGRRTFWLLLPGALAGSIANLPFFGWNASVLAVNVGGALIPLALALYLPSRWIGGRTVLRGVAALGAVVAALFAIDLLPTAPGRSGLALFDFAAVPFPPFAAAGIPPVAIAAGLLGLFGIGTAALLLYPEGRPDPARRAAAGRALAFLLLALLGVLLTFATTQAVPGVGILSTFPYYFLAPVLLGGIAVLAARPLLGLPSIAGIPIGYGAATLGVTLGADLLRQPPLYGGPPELLSIGGAGVFDLVYLSGLIAAASGYLVWRWGARRHPEGDGPAAPAPAAPPAIPTPELDLREAARAAGRGEPTASLRGGLRAADGAVAETRRLLDLGAAGPDLWAGLGTPGWVGGDHRNLRALAASPRPTLPEALRGLQAAEQLVAIARDRARRRFASVGERAAAAGIDLLLVTAPALLLWIYLIRTGPAVALVLLNGVPFNAAVYGYIAYGFLYFFLAEAAWGSTVGKRLLRIELLDRTRFAPPGRISVLLRNLPRILPLALVGELVAPALALLLRGGGGLLPAGAPPLVGETGLLLLLLAAAGLAVVGAISLLFLRVTGGRERIGDLWAGTWVVRRGRAAGPPPPPPPARPEGPAGRAEERSG